MEDSVLGRVPLGSAGRTLLVELAHTVIRQVAGGLPKPSIDLCGVPPDLLEARASFVTLTLDGALRGCVGNLIACEALCSSVIRNAHGAATSDARFEPVSVKEAELVRVRISVLSALQPLIFTDSSALIDQLIPGRHGVVLVIKGQRATFLPQVWDLFPDKVEFLGQLARKAGLDQNAWLQPGTEVQVYEAEAFGDA